VSSQRNAIRTAPRVSPLRSLIQSQAQSLAAPKPEPPSQRWSSSSRGTDPSETPRVDNFRSPFARGGTGNTRKSYADLSHMSMPDSADISFVSSAGGRRSIDQHSAIPPRMSNCSADSYDHSFEMRTPSKWGGDSFGGMDHTTFSQTSSSSFCSLGTVRDSIDMDI